MYLQMKSSCALSNTCNHIFRAHTAWALWAMARSGAGSGSLSCPTPQMRSRALGGHWGSPSPGHWAPPWGWEQARRRPGSGPAGGPSSAWPRAGQGPGLWGPGDRPCCDIAGAGADAPGGCHGVLGRGQGGGSPRGWAGTLGPVGAPWALTPTQDLVRSGLLRTKPG